MTAGFEINGPDAGTVASGFVNQTDSTLAFNAGSRTFTIAPAMPGGSFSFYVAGLQFIKSAAETYVWPDTEGLWFIYYDGAGVLQATQNSTLIAQIFSGAGAAVAALYWDAVSNLIVREIDERHNIALPGSVHLYLHRYFGTAYESGLALGDFTIVGGVPNTAPPAQFSCANGVVADEDLRRIIADGSPQNLAPVISLPVFYLDGASPGVWRRKAADTFPVIYSGTAGYVGANGRLPWNQLNAGTWQLTEVTNNDFVLLHIFASTDILEPIFGIQGQAVYTSAALARAGALVEINNLANVLALLSTEKRAIGTVIFQTGATYANVPKAKVVLTDTGANYVDWRATAFFAGIVGGGPTASLVFVQPEGSEAPVLKVKPSDVTAPALAANSTVLLPRHLGSHWFRDLPGMSPIGVYDARDGLLLTGTAIDQASDLSGLGNHATALAAQRPTFAATGWSDSGPAISLDGIAQFFDANSLAKYFQRVQAPSQPVVYVVQLRMPTVTGVFSLFGMSGATQITAYGIANGAQAYEHSTGANYDAQGLVTINRDHVLLLSVQKGNGKTSFWLDGKTWTTPGEAMVGATINSMTAATLFARRAAGAGVAGQFVVGLVRNFSLFSGIGSNAAYRLACRALIGGAVNNIICVGNSYTDGTHGGGSAYPTHLQNFLGTQNDRYFVTNRGHGGFHTSQLIALIATEVAPFYQPASNNIVVFWELSNQFVQNVSDGMGVNNAADASVTLAWDYCSQVRALGFRVIVVTTMYRDGANYVVVSKAVGDAAVDRMNAAIRASWTQHADGIWDPNADPLFSDPTTTGNLTILVDGAHFGDMARQVQASSLQIPLTRLSAELG